jgi:hypothetical protein
MTQIFLYIAMFCSITGYATYWYGLRKQLVRPNRFSWLIWSCVTTVEALTYQAVNEGLVQNLVFFMSAASCLFITLAIWGDGNWSRPSRAEFFSMGMALTALVLWIGFQSSWWAHVLVVATVPVSFIPTWISAGEDKRREMSPAWGFWSLGDLATLLLIGQTTQNHSLEFPYIVVELICHAAIWWRVGLSSINPIRTLRDQDVVPDPRYFCGNPPHAFKIEHNGKGMAVLAGIPFAKGAYLMEFTGPRYHRSEILAHRSGNQDRFLQVDAETYLGPSGNLDDLVNHSCAPNGGLRFEDGRIFLVALKAIAEHEEICWDYSTTSSSSSFSMRCACGTPECRDVIGDFEFLDEAIQQRYRDLQLVPPYLRRSEPVVPGSPAPDPMPAVRVQTEARPLAA